MAIWFRIKKGELYAHDYDPMWFINRLIHWITFRKYQRNFGYTLHCEVDDAEKLRIGDVFVGGTERPPIFFVITDKRGNRKISAVSMNPGTKSTIDNLHGITVVVKSSRVKKK